MKIIQQPWTEVITHRYLSFDIVGAEGSSYGFPCDAEGNVETLNETAQENYEKCLNGTYEVGAPYIEEFTNNYRHPRIGLCDCGSALTLNNFTNPCDCGADYNMSGQLLAPRHYWGEETGEHWTECV